MERLSIYPIQHELLWKLYKNAKSQDWTAEGIDFSKDDWDSLTDSQKYHLGLNLGFFANSDKVVGDNLNLNFSNLPEEVLPYEGRVFYNYQAHNEDIHAETYQLIIQSYYPKYEERIKMLNAALTIPVVEEKMSWALKWLNVSASFELRLIAFACIEGE